LRLSLAPPIVVSIVVVFLVVLLGVATTGCGANRYTSPSAAHPPDLSAGPIAGLVVFRNRTVTLRLLDNRMDRPQSAALVDEVRAALSRALEQAQVGRGPDGPATLEVRILRYAAEGQLSKWRACVGFGATVEIPPARRHDLGTERCSTVANVWGTDSAAEALRTAFREAVRDLVAQLDGLPPAGASP
jgi:hypothetical protein